MEESQVGLCQVAASYFHNLFNENNTQTPPNLDHITLRVTESDNTSMLQPLSLEEFTKAIKQMHSDKAPTRMALTRHSTRDSGHSLGMMLSRPVPHG